MPNTPMDDRFHEEHRRRLLRRARAHFLKADHVLALYRTSSESTDLPRLARTIMDDRTCDAVGIELLTRKVLVLAAMIELHKQQAERTSRGGEELERIERELIKWCGRWPNMTSGQMEDVEIVFSFLGVLLSHCDPSHWPAELIADYASGDTRWGINNACFRNDSVVREYVRKWEFGWKRFLPWCGNTDNGLGIDWLHKAAEAGNVVAQRQFAECFASGKGLAQNYSHAAVWYRKAAEQGDKIAQRIFGYYCDHGRGVSQDRAEATKWYRAAAERGDAQAQYNLGSLYYHGTGAERDYVEAANWFRKAAAQELPDAQSDLGLCYFEGHGVAQNYNQAVEYYQRAANQGYSEAQYNLANCYCTGLGVSQDFVEAYKWLSLIPIGKLFGRLECARKLRDEIAGKITSEQIEESRRRAASFRIRGSPATATGRPLAF
jgi:hypothetical protein